MTKYFDEDFFKFFMGFVAIISFSLILVLATRVYKDKSEAQTANVIQATIPASNN